MINSKLAVNTLTTRLRRQALAFQGDPKPYFHPVGSGGSQESLEEEELSVAGLSSATTSELPDNSLVSFTEPPASITSPLTLRTQQKRQSILGAGTNT